MNNRANIDNAAVISEQTELDLQANYRLAPGVSIRPERFGGLVYRYDNRRLYFLHSHELVAFVTQLDGKVALAEALNDFMLSSQLTQSTRLTFKKALFQLEKLGTLVKVLPKSECSPQRG